MTPSSSEYKCFCSDFLVYATPEAKNKNWNLVSYIVDEHIDLIKNSSNQVALEFLYEVLKNKQFDIADKFINKMASEIFHEKQKFYYSNTTDTLRHEVILYDFMKLLKNKVLLPIRAFTVEYKADTFMHLFWVLI